MLKITNILLSNENNHYLEPNSTLTQISHFQECLDSQIKCLLPDRVEVAVDGLGPLFGLSHLDGDIRVTGTSFILGL